jgi:hypothetical protein
MAPGCQLSKGARTRGNSTELRSFPVSPLCLNLPAVASARRFTPPLFWETGGLAGLLALVGYFLAISWRKWPDPLIDFGLQLYIPWRISEGAVLYRDILYPPGPLSQSIDASLFACFGPGLMVLATANIIVFLGILGLIYLLFRRAWGIAPALAASAIFVAVFGFSQFVGIGNYNYATPYAPEAPHGLFVCLLLVLVLVRWVETGSPGVSLLAGILFGLTLLLKPEMMLAGGLTLVVAGVARYGSGRPFRALSLALMASGVVLPTVLFIFYFGRFMSWPEAVRAAGSGWLNVITSTRYTGDILEVKFLGLDHPWRNFEAEALATLSGGLLLALIAASACAIDRIAHRWLSFLGMALLAVFLATLAICGITWLEAGRCLPGVIAVYLLFSLVSFITGKDLEAIRPMLLTRLLLALLALAFLARMLLNARIYHYGFSQAALAAIIVPAVLLGELPQQLKLGPRGAAAVAIGTLALFVPGVVILCLRSHQFLALKTVAVGAGGDRLYAYSPRIDPTGEIVNDVIKTLQKARPGETLLVLPEGLMINYQARLPSPISPYTYFPGPTGDSHEDETVADLEQHPPDWVVIISRDLREYGVDRYGERPGAGQQMMGWVEANYETAQTIGGDPLDVRQRGAVILRRNNAGP